MLARKKQQSITTNQRPYTYSGYKYNNEKYILLEYLKGLAINPNIPQIYNIGVNPVIQMEKAYLFILFHFSTILYHEHAIFLHNWA